MSYIQIDGQSQKENECVSLIFQSRTIPQFLLRDTSLTPVLTQPFFPKPPTTFLTWFCRGERRKYAGKKSRLNRGSNSQPPGHESDTLTMSHLGGAFKGSWSVIKKMKMSNYLHIPTYIWANDYVSDKTNFNSNESNLQKKTAESDFHVHARTSRNRVPFSLIL